MTCSEKRDLAGIFLAWMKNPSISDRLKSRKLKIFSYFRPLLENEYLGPKVPFLRADHINFYCIISCVIHCCEAFHDSSLAHIHREREGEREVG